MTRVQTPSLTPTEYSDYLLSSPGWGGLNIADLEYDIEDNQSPDMVNMMVENGALQKRYGQVKVKLENEIVGPILAIGYYGGKYIVQANTSFYEVEGNKVKTIRENVEGGKGRFFTFNRQLLFMNGTLYLCYDENGLHELEAYVPDVAINMNPDGTNASLIEDYNRLCSKFKNTFNGNGTDKTFKLLVNELQGSEENPKVECIVGVDEYSYGAESKGFTVDWTGGTVTFTEAPPEGINNVIITATMSVKSSEEYIKSILECRYMYNYGGNNNSRLFVAGNGSSCFYYSDVFDASYFPETQYINVGNGTDDITGFGEQYSTLMVFKPKQVYGVTYSFNETTQKPQFDTYTVNALIGCDCPDTIQMVNNQLTWLNTTYGVCTMASTTIKDEKNIVYISRNINGGFQKGLLQNESIKEALAFNFDGKYWICLKNGDIYAWDYRLTPYTNSGYMDKDALRLSWFKFANFVINCAVIVNGQLYFGNKTLLTVDSKALYDYIPNSNYPNSIEPIRSYYKTKLFDFGYIDYLKTVKRMYVDVRGDTPSLIKIKYITSDVPNGEYDVEDIIIYSRLWDEFTYNTFGYERINFKKEFARNVSMKKINIFAVMFENDQISKDMSISSIKLKWFVSQRIK